MWVLLHELAHHYIYETSRTEVDIYSVNECAQLSASAAVENAQNFVFYVASKRPPPSRFMCENDTVALSPSSYSI